MPLGAVSLGFFPRGNNQGKSKFTYENHDSRGNHIVRDRGLGQSSLFGRNLVPLALLSGTALAPRRHRAGRKGKDKRSAVRLRPGVSLAHRNRCFIFPWLIPPVPMRSGSGDGCSLLRHSTGEAVKERHARVVHGAWPQRTAGRARGGKAVLAPINSTKKESAEVHAYHPPPPHATLRDEIICVLGVRGRESRASH